MASASVAYWPLANGATAAVRAGDIPITRLAGVAFKVADIEKARQFYPTVLGLDEVYTLKDAAGSRLTGRLVTWESSNPGVATVSNSGLVTGVAPGQVTITASSEGTGGRAAISVTSLVTLQRMPDAKDRAELIEFLARATRPTDRR